MAEKKEIAKAKPGDKRLGNQFWRARSTHGRKPIFPDPNVLWDACVEYFDWVEDNPLIETKLVSYQGEHELVEVPKIRAMTIGGLCLFLDIDFKTWQSYQEKKDFIQVTKQAEESIRSQKFSGAAADLLNANIIARDLGLRDKVETELVVPQGVVFNMSFDSRSKKDAKEET